MRQITTRKHEMRRGVGRVTKKAVEVYTKKKGVSWGCRKIHLWWLANSERRREGR
jgi:hypothetical protein